MASLAIASRHRRYTAGTHFLAEWLVATSLANGFSLRRLQQECIASEGTEFGDAEYLVPIRLYQVLAQFIADAKRPIAVPRTVLGTLEEVIRLREETKRQLLLICRPVDSGHDHIIDVMRSVRTILRPRTPQPASATSVGGNTAVQNLFSSLTLEEVPESFLSRAPQTSSPASSQNQKASAQLPDDLQEAKFSFIELIQDLITMASLLKKPWADIALMPTGQRDHVALLRASVTTETAIHVAQTLEAESAPLFNKHGGAIKLIESFYIEGKEAISEVANQMKELYAIYGLLQDCRAKVNGEDVLKRCPDWVLTSEADTTESQNASQSQRVHILRLLPAMFLLCRNVQSELAIDSFSKLFGQLLLRGHMSISVLFATKVFLDICETLGNQLGCGFEILGGFREELYKTVTETLNLNRQVKLSDWPEKNDESLVRLGRKVDFWVTRDPVAWTAKKTSWKLAPNILPQRHPLLCGVLLAQICSEAHCLGIDYANASGSVLRMAHLYHAARVSHYLDTAWPQMERVMTVQRTEALFVGSERPTDPAQIFPRYNLATGASIVIFSQGKRRVGNPRSKLPKEKLKRLQSGTPVLISLTEHLQAVSKNSANPEFPRTIAAMTRGPTSKAVPLVAALESLANAVAEEASAASVDYFRLHRQS
ncbi:hypothetical protein DL771_009123 [Monosporascus sp. 5C6A]|nr:hypothetical protein DL771_009123 [Monosporascus sp. 5C6A]